VTIRLRILWDITSKYWSGLLESGTQSALKTRPGIWIRSYRNLRWKIQCIDKISVDSLGPGEGDAYIESLVTRYRRRPPAPIKPSTDTLKFPPLATSHTRGEDTGRWWHKRLQFYLHKPAFLDHFGGRKSKDFAENPLPRISMFTMLVGLWSYFPTNPRLSNWLWMRAI
jgi:hypothetical protein